MRQVCSKRSTPSQHRCGRFSCFQFSRGVSNSPPSPSVSLEHKEMEQVGRKMATGEPIALVNETLKKKTFTKIRFWLQMSLLGGPGKRNETSAVSRVEEPVTTFW
ncbi:hypothetical protein Y1Q_0015700 [Alligator mississippiensis]|uniref:Uncharacterized protein n=1 Tax=Alligator mississippiensis TaxID=8496 RepID=A0A151NP34_ALLMI|nr:hypothetical protein Y1Q_0015700 [Alligator mississippiensis]